LAINNLYPLYVLWNAAFVYPYIPWFFVVVLFIIKARNDNSIRVLAFSSESKERVLLSQIEALNGEKKKSLKTIARLRQMQQASAEEAEGQE